MKWINDIRAANYYFSSHISNLNYNTLHISLGAQQTIENFKIIKYHATFFEQNNNNINIFLSSSTLLK